MRSIQADAFSVERNGRCSILGDASSRHGVRAKDKVLELGPIVTCSSMSVCMTQSYDVSCRMPKLVKDFPEMPRACVDCVDVKHVDKFSMQLEVHAHDPTKCQRLCVYLYLIWLEVFHAS
eukprot:TRINITY_DN42560_c0_g1_i1.p1 TRINITY_DN42560_c0_g1~~TRINITY_DN42560_c0_g1_i1.p1  ORF type:complete len:120 (+),score=14.07 TRINITY_DN42560_c0_g1_i1:355-714(+)